MSLHIDGIVFSLQQHGGISVYTHELLRQLARERMPAILTLESPLKQQAVAANTAAVSTLARSARAIERYRSCRPAPGATVFHSTYYRRPLQRGLAQVVTVHDFTYERFARGPRRWVHVAQKHAAIRAAQVLVCVSKATQDDLRELVGLRPEQQVHVIPNGVGTSFRPLDAHAQTQTLTLTRRPYLLFVGDRAGYKNFALALQALALLPDDIELHCVGGGALRPEETTAAPEALRARVRHLGYVDDVALNRLYNGALALVYPSAYEGFGIPVLEAMRAGCPIVGIRCKAVLEVSAEALTTAAAAEPAALAAAIESTFAPERRQALVRAGIERAAGYSWERTHAATLQVYRSLGLDLGPQPD